MRGIIGIIFARLFFGNADTVTIFNTLEVDIEKAAPGSGMPIMKSFMASTLVSAEGMMQLFAPVVGWPSQLYNISIEPHRITFTLNDPATLNNTLSFGPPNPSFDWQTRGFTPGMFDRYYFDFDMTRFTEGMVLEAELESSDLETVKVEVTDEAVEWEDDHKKMHRIPPGVIVVEVGPSTTFLRREGVQLKVKYSIMNNVAPCDAAPIGDWVQYNTSAVELPPSCANKHFTERVPDHCCDGPLHGEKQAMSMFEMMTMSGKNSCPVAQEAMGNEPAKYVHMACLSDGSVVYGEMMCGPQCDSCTIEHVFPPGCYKHGPRDGMFLRIGGCHCASNELTCGEMKTEYRSQKCCAGDGDQPTGSKKLDFSSSDNPKFQRMKMGGMKVGERRLRERSRTKSAQKHAKESRRLV